MGGKGNFILGHEDTYRHEFLCDNCQNGVIKDIPKGQSTQTYILKMDNTCPYCGCKILEVS